MSFDHLLPGVIADYYEIDEHVNPVKYSEGVKAFHRKVREAKCAKGVRRSQRKSKMSVSSPGKRQYGGNFGQFCGFGHVVLWQRRGGDGDLS